MADEQWKKVTSYWPIIIAALGLTVTAASANTRLDNLKDRVDYIYQNGPPAQADRLARIETRQEQIVKTLDSMQAQLEDIREQQDRIYSVSPKAKEKLRRL